MLHSVIIRDLNSTLFRRLLWLLMIILQVSEATTTPSSLSPIAANSSLKAAGIFEKVNEQLKLNPDTVAKIKGSFLWQITVNKKVAGK